MDVRLDGRIAFITGAGSGLGRAMAIRMSAEGAAVMCTDMNGNAAEDTSALISESGGQASALELDVTNELDVDKALNKAISQFGGLNILVNNAGIGGRNGWEQTVSVNLTGVYNGLLYGAPKLAELGGGAIVNIASIAGLNALLSSGITLNEVPVPGPERSAAYVASKHGVIGLTKQFAINFAKENIRVNAICPGYIYTPMTKNLTEKEEGREFLEALHPMGRLGEDREIASAAAFLVSDDASFITGVALPVDGGYTAR